MLAIFIVLLILSEYSLKSDWVEHEVRMAQEWEKKMGRDVPCPVAIDDSRKDSRWFRRVLEQVLEHNIPDFQIGRMMASLEVHSIS